ncbi:peroxidase 2 isoform X1 [Selaginella moellendorffii]|uniref:peroxidase 2 isoform X1 n=1 Tax=Selaginella moellendorffii TaxID=88036 RepID=UPI000D1CECE6|nr:peroxidase 2 isoform X1 [Selaginella moellendorffii]|eukprot:XP_024526353.1 peroxidase 2 isoform X1 [Selaginella moellendorffii]
MAAANSVVLVVISCCLIAASNGMNFPSFFPRDKFGGFPSFPAQNIFSPLMLGYYNRPGICNQNPEVIIQKIVNGSVAADRTLAAGLLRMHFHDAFVRGTEASVLLKSPNNDAERNAIPNLSLRGFEVIDAAKAAVEKVCPNVVSCADILALAARDSVVAIGGPWWPVPTGRRDGVQSHANETTDLPPPSANFTQLLSMFQKKNLDKVDLVALSAAHTIGRGHCGAFSSRIYDAAGNNAIDPTLDAAYANKLRGFCPPRDTVTTVEMDPNSSLNFDSHYFQAVLAKQGLFKSDAALLTDAGARSLVQTGASAPIIFKSQFGFSMTKMGRIGVLTGRPGEPPSQIRKQCAFVNP